jgi:negative regulator of flagellin synthesis FlgM
MPAGAGLEDVVQLTDLGARLQVLTQSVAAVSEVDHARVEQIRQALVEGSFQVEPEATADKLLAMENLLDNGQSR